MTLDTSDIAGTERGLSIGPVEDVLILVGDTYPDSPPDVYVAPQPRFLGYPHVICGCKLCVYLDPRREWNPTYGMAQLLERTWEWFDNAANDRFDPRTSLYHAVGGATPVTKHAPTVVVRHGPPPSPASIAIGTVRIRSDSRLDLIHWEKARPGGVQRAVTILHVPSPLPLGVEKDLGGLAQQVEASGGATARQVVDVIYRRIQLTEPSRDELLGLIVEHPTEADLPALVFGTIPPGVTDELRRPSHTRQPASTPIDWIPVSDERPSISVPRDEGRPTAALRGQTIEIWGCGGLGSWIAEFITRARPATVVVRDGATVHGGHLVRQNYTEADVGKPKAIALAQRLGSIHDDTNIQVGGASALEALQDHQMPSCDVVIDATINETVAHRLDEAARATKDPPLLCQVSTDRRSATLGLLITANAGCTAGPATIDRAVAEHVLGRSDLESYHEFWQPAGQGAELIPSPGCSAPTYHGSAADLAVTAAALVNLIAVQMTAPIAGVHLVAACHSGCGTPLEFIRYSHRE